MPILVFVFMSYTRVGMSRSPIVLSAGVGRHVILCLLRMSVSETKVDAWADFMSQESVFGLSMLLGNGVILAIIDGPRSELLRAQVKPDSDFKQVARHARLWTRPRGAPSAGWARGTMSRSSSIFR